MEDQRPTWGLRSGDEGPRTGARRLGTTSPVYRHLVARRSRLKALGNRLEVHTIGTKQLGPKLDESIKSIDMSCAFENAMARKCGGPSSRARTWSWWWWSPMESSPAREAASGRWSQAPERFAGRTICPVSVTVTASSLRRIRSRSPWQPSRRRRRRRRRCWLRARARLQRRAQLDHDSIRLSHGVADDTPGRPGERAGCATAWARRSRPARRRSCWPACCHA